MVVRKEVSLDCRVGIGDSQKLEGTCDTRRKLGGSLVTWVRIRPYFRWVQRLRQWVNVFTGTCTLNSNCTIVSTLCPAVKMCNLRACDVSVSLWRVSKPVTSGESQYIGCQVLGSDLVSGHTHTLSSLDAPPAGTVGREKEIAWVVHHVQHDKSLRLCFNGRRHKETSLFSQGKWRNDNTESFLF